MLEKMLILFALKKAVEKRDFVVVVVIVKLKSKHSVIFSR